MRDYEIGRLEERRQILQQELDTKSNVEERNRYGQYATPPALARDIMTFALSVHGQRPIDFLEPSCGSGAFISALYDCLTGFPESVVGYELDPRFVEVARSLWEETGGIIKSGDFLWEQLKQKASLLVANPPYSRHHHLSAKQKQDYRKLAEQTTGLTVNGLSGLYVYFMLIAHQHLQDNAVSAWLIPSEFLDVNFGRVVKSYLSQRVSLHRIHRYAPEDNQFNDAMVTSSVVVFRNAQPSAGHQVEFTTGGTITAPEKINSLALSDLDPESKWSPIFSGRSVERRKEVPILADFFDVRRGIATGNNSFFIRPREELEERGINRENITPLLPSSRHVKVDIVESDEQGFPSNVAQLGLINTTLSEIALADSDPALAQYLASADEKVRSGYLVRNRQPWYRQEEREPAPFLMTYMGRSKTEAAAPFRFIANKSRAIATNGYLMLYPKGQLKQALNTGSVTLEEVHEALNSITPGDMRDGGRVYGGGLHKIEPKELSEFDASRLAALIPSHQRVESLFPLRAFNSTLGKSQ